MGCEQGPDGTQYLGGQCVYVGGGSSCDERGGKTCWYGLLDLIQLGGRVAASSGRAWFGGQFVDGGFRIGLVGPLAEAGVKVGDLLTVINGRPVALMDPERNPFSGYQEKRPATWAQVVRVVPGSSGTFALRLKRAA